MMSKKNSVTQMLSKTGSGAKALLRVEGGLPLSLFIIVYFLYFCLLCAFLGTIHYFWAYWCFLTISLVV